MMPTKRRGWMVNFQMRRVEPVEAEESPYNTPSRARYRGPRRTYMLGPAQVFDSELEALVDLHTRMTARYCKLAGQLTKYRAELESVAKAIGSRFPSAEDCTCWRQSGEPQCTDCPQRSRL